MDEWVLQTLDVINSKSGVLKFDVKNSQIEIDGGYEGLESLSLIEAKNSLSKDF